MRININFTFKKKINMLKIIILIFFLNHANLCNVENFDSKNFLCCEGTLRPKFGSNQCCGNETYSPHFFQCCQNVIRFNHEKCCGNSTFNPRLNQCCNNVIQPRLNSQLCCDTQLYRPSWYQCCEGS